MHQGEYLKKVVERSGMKGEDFAKLLEISRSNLYKMFEKESIKSHYVDKIRQIEDGLDNGERTDIILHPSKTESLGDEKTSIPYYDYPVMGGNVANFGEHMKSASYFLSIPHFKDCDIAVRVNGHSMYPKYCNGDIVVCKKIDDRSHIPYGEPCIVILADHSVLKYIHPHPTDKTMYTLKSANEKFEPMEIKRDDVLGVYLVRGKLELT
jgi:SOS-response transcriptional repressor LexA